MTPYEWGPYRSERDRMAKIPETVERTRWYSHERELHRLFPMIADARVAHLLTELLDEISPLCVDDPDGYPRIFGRGSWIHRGFTDRDNYLFAPPGYFRIPQIFGGISYKPDLMGNPTPLVDSVCKRLAQGPDADYMYKKRAEVSDDEMIEQIVRWADRWNKQSVDLRMEVTHVPLAQWNGEADTRIYASLTFFRKSKLDSTWQPIFRADFGEEPDEHTASLDGRLSMYATSWDMLSVAPIRKNGNGVWSLVYDGRSKQLFRQPNRIIASGALPHNKVVAVNRMTTQDVMWPRKTVPDYVRMQGSDDWFHPDPSVGIAPFPYNSPKVYLRDVTIGAMPAIQKRAADIVCQGVLGLSFDPYAYLEMGRVTGALGFTALGRLLASADVRTALTEYQMRRESSVNARLVDDFRLGCVDRLSMSYRRNHFSMHSAINFFGPFLLVSDLVSIGALESGTPITLERIVQLLDPVFFQPALE